MSGLRHPLPTDPPKGFPMTSRRLLIALIPLTLLAGCVTAPTGPSVMALPGAGKSFEQFRVDDAECRQYAYYQLGGSEANQAGVDAAMRSAAIGTAIGGALTGALANAARGQGQPGAAPAPGAPAVPGLPGGLGSILTSLGGSAALGTLVEQFQRNGGGNFINQWIQSGPNPSIDPAQLQQVLGAETVQNLAARTGMEPQALLSQLAVELPHAVDQMTPEGRLPTDDEIQQLHA